MIKNSFISLIFIISILSSAAVKAQWTGTGANNLANLGSNPVTHTLNETTIFIAGGTNGSGIVIYRSTNSGMNFTSLPTNGLPASSKVVATIWAKDQNTIFIGEGGPGNNRVTDARFWRTTNGGLNWIQLGSSGNGNSSLFHSIVFSKIDNNFGIAHADPTNNSGQFLIWKTTDGGFNWDGPTAVSVGKGAYGKPNSAFVVDMNFYGFGYRENNSAYFARTTNGGANWEHVKLPGATDVGNSYAYVSSVSFNEDKLHGFATVSTTSDSIWVTANGGLNWTKTMVPNVPNNFSGTENIEYVFGTTTAFYVASNSSITYTFKLVDFGNEIISYTPSTDFVSITNFDSYYASGDAPGDATVFAVSSNGTVKKLQDSPLPVTLASFTYTITGRSVKLMWATSMEQNNAGFEIYRIAEGKDKNVISNWTKIGFIEGKGNVNGNTQYSFTDNIPDAGKYNYRLKQIDYNGNYEYFDMNGTVTIESPKKTVLNQNFPNPFNPVTSISFEIPVESRITLKVYDISGREVASLINETRTAGYHTVQFNASNLSSGIYFYKFTAEANGSKTEFTRKMNLIK